MADTMDPVNERTSALYVATLTDEEGGTDATTLATLTLTLYDKSTDAIINTREKQDVLNTNGVTLYAAPRQIVAAIGTTPARVGNFVWQLEPDDNLVISTKAVEQHIALFHGTWGDGAAFYHDVIIPVTNIRRAPEAP